MRFVLAILATLQFAAASEVPSGHRVALLIGNAKYEGFTLAPVTASLDRVEEALERSGFIVTRAENLKGEEQKKTAEAFARALLKVNRPKWVIKAPSEQTYYPETG